jgi:hypothetical protein
MTQHVKDISKFVAIHYHFMYTLEAMQEHPFKKLNKGKLKENVKQSHIQLIKLQDDERLKIFYGNDHEITGAEISNVIGDATRIQKQFFDLMFNMDLKELMEFQINIINQINSNKDESSTSNRNSGL